VTGKQTKLRRFVRRFILASGTYHRKM